jgi:hypothetical protein
MCEPRSACGDATATVMTYSTGKDSHHDKCGDGGDGDTHCASMYVVSRVFVESECWKIECGGGKALSYRRRRPGSVLGRS